MKPLRIGTRDSQLAVWQASTVQGLLKKAGVPSELVYMKSEGDVDHAIVDEYERSLQQYAGEDSPAKKLKTDAEQGNITALMCSCSLYRSFTEELARPTNGSNHKFLTECSTSCTYLFIIPLK